MGLPLDIKWMIFDIFLQHLAVQPKAVDIYALPHEWPKWPKDDLSEYFALVSTCEQMRKEATSYFEQRILPNMTFYFDSAPALYEFYQSVFKLKPEYKTARFSLRTPYKLGLPHTYHRSRLRKFVLHQAGLPGSWVYSSQWSFPDLAVGERHTVEHSGGVSLRVHEEGHSKFEVFDFPTKTALKLFVRRIQGEGSSGYWELVGEVQALDWTGYDHQSESQKVIDAIEEGVEQLAGTAISAYEANMSRLVGARCDLEE